MSVAEANKPGKLRTEMRRQRRRQLFGVFVLFFVVIALVLLGTVPLFWPATSQKRTIEVTVPHRANVATIGDLLEQEGVIRSALAFRAYARWRGEGGRFKSGRYALSSHLSLGQIIKTLNAGPDRNIDTRARVTIPEGYRLEQIADLLEEKGVTSKEAFLRVAASEAEFSKLRVEFPPPKVNLEGYLFPDTYRFETNTPAAKVVETLLANFTEKFYRPHKQEIERSDRELHELVTIASMIEREAQAPEDRARIAGVIGNRVRRKMRLEIDATVLYALGYHKTRVLLEDLKVDSPYNTYKYRGLPPGPIASPGLPSLLATLKPERHEYLYYVARPNGKHAFTRTLAEHQMAIKLIKKERQSEEKK